MPRLIILSVACLIFSQGWGQTEFITKREISVTKYRTVDLRDQGQTDGFIQYLENPKPGGDSYSEFLQGQKDKASRMYPRIDMPLNENRSIVDTPELLNNFAGNSWTAGIPLDNHLALNNEGQIVTVVNTQMVIMDPTGFWQESYNLDDFWSDLGEDERYFDPRVIFDPAENRFILTMMQDFSCDNSNIVFAFSASSDPTGAWHLYQFSGCPNDDATFADYPMISLTDEELFFTYNAVYQDSSWQTGFGQTFIYQINKLDGYAGKELNWRSWSGIKYENRNLRNICPIKYGSAELGPEMYFLSNRNFDIQNDTVFMVYINGTMDKPDIALTIEPLVSDIAYGVPPNARQPKDFLQTNDARVLDGFFIDDQIQFVSTTMHTATGRSAVFHGIISDVSYSPFLSAGILGSSSDYLGYPGISYTGINAGETEAIIVAAHSSPDRFPGISALYFNFDYSSWMTVKEGLRNIDMFKVNNPFGVDPTLERWGDYSGIQPQYNEEGTVWVASCYGKPGSVNATWIGHLARPGIETSVSGNSESQNTLKAFPNPALTIISFEVEIDAKGKLLEANLYDLNGKLINNVFSENVRRDGPFRFHYDCGSLAPGMYILNMTLEGEQWGSEQFVINN